MITLTDRVGKPLVHPDYLDEPLPGSIVLTEGEHGTCFQRHFSDGLWHSTRGGRARRWAELLTRNNLVLVYDAEERE